MSIKRIFGVFFRYLYVAKKGPHQLSDLFYWPFVDILIWGITAFWVQASHMEGNLPTILLTGLIFWQIAWRGSIDISFNFLQELWHRNLINLFSTPLKLSEWIFGTLLLSLLKLVITICFGTFLVYSLFSINIFAIGWAFLPATLCLLLFGWSVSLFSSCFIIFWGHKVEMVAWMTAFLFIPFSAIYYPVEMLPSWAQMVAWCLPTTYIFEGLRETLQTGSFPLKNFFISIGINALFGTLALFTFYKTFQKSKDKGLARLE